jgi:cyanophycinase-like exopeptidase
MAPSPHPGTVVLFGSGETSPVGGRIFEAISRRNESAPGLRIAVLETPAGFEPNSALVAGNIADFLCRRLAARRPHVEVVPARQRGTDFSPDDLGLLPPILKADMLFLGPGSPTYAIRQLRGSRAWDAVLARHLQGATTVLASAAMVAAGKLALPVYEIYKVGEALHWTEGLDLFGPYGLSLVFIPHWNNNDGGAKLDTSRCYMGQARFEALRALLPPETSIVGIDENTALVLDPAAGSAEVLGEGCVTVIRTGAESRFEPSQRFGLTLLGPFDRTCVPPSISPEVTAAAAASAAEPAVLPACVPPDVRALAEARDAARARRDWSGADALRRRLAALGWRVSDGPAGQVVEPMEPG